LKVCNVGSTGVNELQSYIVGMGSGSLVNAPIFMKIGISVEVKAQEF
jgi:hypothetical protein